MAACVKTSILVADDSPETVRIIRKILWKIGFRSVDDAANGLEALVKMSEKKYDLVIADWNMEPMSGYELLMQTRKDPHIARTRGILMTAEPKIEQVIAAKKAGAFYIGKPFTAEVLKQKIDALFLASDPQRERVSL